MIYNFPVVTAGIDLDSDVINTLAQHPNIVGTKLSCGQIGRDNIVMPTLNLTNIQENSSGSVLLSLRKNSRSLLVDPTSFSRPCSVAALV